MLSPLPVLEKQHQPQRLNLFLALGEFRGCNPCGCPRLGRHKASPYNTDHPAKSQRPLFFSVNLCVFTSVSSV